MSRSPAIPDQAEQYYAGLTLRQPSYPISQEGRRTSSIPTHSLPCTPSGHSLALQMDSDQRVSRRPPGESFQITAPDLPKAGMLDTQRTQLLIPDSASGFQAGREASVYWPPSREAHTASPYTPGIALSQAEHQSEEEENLESSGSDGDEDGNGVEKTTAERLAEKRKMKRFRLTHAQTRYLMSEFARQAHPNANQRESLSRDIPGLGPRQVQVWFQNRRAKLKRLTTDDQERMMRSRALPEDFDFTQTLQPAHGEQRSPLQPVASLPDPSLTDGGRRSTLTLRQDHQGLSPTSMSSVYTHMPHSGASASGSFSLSPVSSLNEGSYQASHYSASTYSRTGSPTTTPQFTNDMGRSSSFSTSWISQIQEDTNQQGSVNPPSAELLAGPLTQSGTTFTGNPYGYGENSSRSSRAPLMNQGFNRRVSSHVPPINISPVDEHFSTQYSPAAGSADYPSYSAYYTGHVDVDPSQSGQMERPAQLWQSRRSLGPAVNPFQTPVSSNSYPLTQGNMYDATLLGQQRIYTEADIRSFPATAGQPASDVPPRWRGADGCTLYSSNQQ